VQFEAGRSEQKIYDKPCGAFHIAADNPGISSIFDVRSF